MRRVFALCLVLALAGVTASAQMAPVGPRSNGDQSNVNLELKDVDVRVAVQALFRNTGRNFSIDSNVSGTVPAVSFKDVAFETALRNLTKSAGLIYRVDSSSGKDIYIIKKRPDAPPDSPPRDTTMQAGLAVVTNDYIDQPTDKEVRIEKVPLFHTSASEILEMLGSGGRDYTSAFGTAGYGMNSHMGSYGGYGGYGMGSYGGYGGYGNNGYGNYGGYGNYSGYGGGVNFTGGYGSYGGYGSNTGGYGGYGGYGSNTGSYGGYGGYGTRRGW